VDNLEPTSTADPPTMLALTNSKRHTTTLQNAALRAQCR